MACGAPLCLIKLLQHCFTVQNTELDQSFVALARLIKLLQHSTGTLVQMAPGTLVQYRWHSSGTGGTVDQIPPSAAFGFLPTTAWTN